MSKRYFQRIYDEQYYIFDSQQVSEEEIDERIEYDGFCVFEDSMDNVVDVLNEQNNLINELSDFRLVYNAHLFNEWYNNDEIEVYKSKVHYDGEPCEKDWFIVVANTPEGQITNHYHIDFWYYFKIPVLPKVKDKFDYHNSTTVLLRLINMFKR